MSRRERLAIGTLSLLVGFGAWVPTAHHLFGDAGWSASHGVPERARELAARHLRLWTDPLAREAELSLMRRANAEWDFMGRSFLVWSLANLALREPAEAPKALEVMDRIIDETLRLEREEGIHFFLMPYSRRAPFVMQPERSQFVDGEIALSLGLRRLIAERPDYREELSRRVDLMVTRMRQSPVLSAESYPDECWTFCNSIALASIRVHDHLDHTDHSALLDAWISTAKQRLVDPGTGLLVSSYRVDGSALDGPEGSSIWMSAHALQLVDPAFAQDQYRRAARELLRSFAGFGWSREWPASFQGRLDVDSGLVVPLLEASPGASGLALVGAAGFNDGATLDRLHASLDLAAFPSRTDGELRYLASNQVGDAVLLYSTLLGPAFERVGAAR